MTLAVFPSFAFAKSEEWTDPLGEKFKGEPSALLGPLAVFRTGATAIKRFPLHFLSDEDCARFATQLSAKPQRATDWSRAKSAISRSLVGSVERVENGKLIPVTLTGIEPEFYIIFYASSGVGESWGMMGSSMGRYQELRKQYPGMVEGLYYGLNQTGLEHDNMAVSSNLPWLVADADEERRMETVMRLAPEQAPLLLVVTREGAPLFGTTETDEKKIGAVFNQLTDLLKLINPENPLSWSDCVHYQRALQLANHRTGEAPPVLVGNPVNAEMLKNYQVKKFSATLQVDEKGHVQTVALADGFDMPKKMVTPITAALKKAFFAPAVKDGQCVAGTFEYKFEATP